MPRALIDDYMPEWHFREVHRKAIDAPAEVILDAALTFTWPEAPLAYLLMRFTPNDVSGDRPAMADDDEIDQREHEVLYGGIDDYREELDLPGPLAEVFRDWDKPGCVKVLNDIRCADGELTTETRMYCTDERTRREFRRMWIVIRPGSGLVRRSALRAVRRRALRSQSRKGVPE